MPYRNTAIDSQTTKRSTVMSLHPPSSLFWKPITASLLHTSRSVWRSTPFTSTSLWPSLLSGGRQWLIGRYASPGLIIAIDVISRFYVSYRTLSASRWPMRLLGRGQNWLPSAGTSVCYSLPTLASISPLNVSGQTFDP